MLKTHAVIALVTTFACHQDIGEEMPAPTLGMGDKTPPSAARHAHDLQVHWRTVGSFEEMVALSHLVARGHVVSRRHETKVLLPWSDAQRRYLRKKEAGDETAKLSFTVSTIVVDEPMQVVPAALAIGGGTIEAGAQIEVIQRGGPLPCGCIEQAIDDPLLEEGEGDVLFLTVDAKVGAYHVIGGWQGRMAIDAGKVTAMAAFVHPEESSFAAIVDLPIEILRERVDRVARGSTPGGGPPGSR